MRIIITGAGGFLGRTLVEQLADHDVVALDSVADGIPKLAHATPVTGDLCDVNSLQAAMADGCDAVVHLATVPGGAAEQNPDLARRVNIEATMALAAAAAEAGKPPRFLFASSIAVFGSPLPARVDDATPLAPTMLYGAHKAMLEQWLATLTRRGALDALSLRLSGVIARPKGPSGMKSAFLSDVFHALSAGESFVMPVSPKATTWLTSLDCAAANFAHALSADLGEAPADRALTLPTLRVQVADLVAEICRQTGAPIEAVSYAPDAALEAGFGALPPVSTIAADRLGFTHDGDLQQLVQRALENLKAAAAL
ncbi:NAD-dependent epimerase/dehydratase family protein [Pseudomaricurvus alcaniphilus]|uniref:NAD-dependent epimerase/dehydratase family protein n=1 Tax=Pseudomaricurvus alcaniphilus TaxID=1166482 RepID=UPI0014088A97|nr:NAD-dependent epimerase/dehydratase family protein [Pseudomaricurvus alcaniphilus]NHN39147.1 NAD-dependent epimerase/dehydratase family protein [Pseudomaricurvus alcaniphilus]